MDTSVIALGLMILSIIGMGYEFAVQWRNRTFWPYLSGRMTIPTVIFMLGVGLLARTALPQGLAFDTALLVALGHVLWYSLLGLVISFVAGLMFFAFLRVRGE